MPKFEQLRQSFFQHWRITVMVLSLVTIAYLVYFHRLNSLLPGYSQTELDSLKNASDWHHIFDNPINAPYLVPLWFLTAVLHHGAYAGRVLAAIFGLVSSLIFYAIVRPMYGYRVAFLSTVLFTMSAGFLHIARLGNGDVLQFGTLAYIGATFGYVKLSSHKRLLFGYGIAALLALLCYVPGLIWFEVVGAFVLYTVWRQQVRRTPRLHLIGWVAVFLIFIAPLIYAISKDPHVALASAGLPPTMHALTHIGSSLWNTLFAITLHSNRSPILWVGHAPLLDAVELILGGLGIYYYVYRNRSRRSYLLLGALVLSWLLVSFGGSVTIACMVPLLYICISRGIDQLLERWFTVFPRNPIARFTGVGLLCAMLLFSVLYQVRSYFVAWPNATATRQEFSHKE